MLTSRQLAIIKQILSCDAIRSVSAEDLKYIAGCIDSEISTMQAIEFREHLADELRISNVSPAHAQLFDDAKWTLTFNGCSVTVPNEGALFNAICDWLDGYIERN